MTAAGGFLNVETNIQSLEIVILNSNFTNSIILYSGGVFIIDSQDVEL